jgi:hypothetical protein
MYLEKTIIDPRILGGGVSSSVSSSIASSASSSIASSVSSSIASSIASSVSGGGVPSSVSGEYIDIHDNSDIYNALISGNRLTKYKLFVCTMSMKIKELYFTFEQLSEKLQICLQNNYTPLCNFTIIAVNTNYNHFCLSGCESELISKKKKKKNQQKKRQTQGDETVFHSAIQLTILLNMQYSDYILLSELDRSNVKKYYIKVYPTTGTTQIPGIINSDLSDGYQLIDGLINYMNCMATLDTATANLATLDTATANLATLDTATASVDTATASVDTAMASVDTATASVDTEIIVKPDHIDYIASNITIIMINYSTSLNIINPRLLFNLNALGEYIYLLQELFIYEGMTELWAIDKFKEGKFAKYNSIILPPFLIMDTKLMNNDKHISFSFVTLKEDFTLKKGKNAVVKVFQGGKLNFLGLKDPTIIELIYKFIDDLIRFNTRQFISVKPLPDRDI